MRSKKRTPQRIVSQFMGGKESIKAPNLQELAKILVRNGGSATMVVSRLNKEIRGRKLLKYLDDDGDVVFESLKVRRRRLRLPLGVSKSRVVNAVTQVPEEALA